MMYCLKLFFFFANTYLKKTIGELLELFELLCGSCIYFQLALLPGEMVIALFDPPHFVRFQLPSNTGELALQGT